MHQPTHSTILLGLFRQLLSIYQSFWPNLYCMYAETSISEVKPCIAICLFTVVELYVGTC